MPFGAGHGPALPQRVHNGTATMLTATGHGEALRATIQFVIGSMTLQQRWAAALLSVLWLLAIPACSDRARSQSAALHNPQVVVGDDDPPLALRPVSLKFGVIGDSGQWSRAQRETAAQLAAQRKNFAFDFVLMLGDNNYGDGSPDSYQMRFEEPFKPLLNAGVMFYAARGNHDAGPQWDYRPFNMGGERYYTFERRTGVLPPLAGDRVQFVALDSVNLDDEQIS